MCRRYHEAIDPELDTAAEDLRALDRDPRLRHVACKDGGDEVHDDQNKQCGDRGRYEIAVEEELHTGKENTGREFRGSVGRDLSEQCFDVKELRALHVFFLNVPDFDHHLCPESCDRVGLLLCDVRSLDEVIEERHDAVLEVLRRFTWCCARLFRE